MRLECEMQRSLRLVEDIAEQARKPQVSRKLGEGKPKGAIGREECNVAVERVRLQCLFAGLPDLFESHRSAWGVPCGA